MRVQERIKNASKVPQIMSGLKAITDDLATHKELVDSLLTAVASPHELPVDDILANLGALQGAQAESLENMVRTIADASAAAQDQQTALRGDLDRTQQALGQIAHLVSRIPTEHPKPERVDLDSAVQSVMSAMDSSTARIQADVGRMRALKAAPKGPMSVSVTARDDDGNIKSIRVEEG